MFIFYVISVILTFVVTFAEYMREKHQYNFTFREKVLGLVIVPLVPGLNLIIACMMLKGLYDSRS